MKPAKQQAVQTDILKSIQEHQISESQESTFGKLQLQRVSAKHKVNYQDIDAEFKRLHEIGLVDGEYGIGIGGDTLELSECALSPSGEQRLEAYQHSTRPSRYR